jgi:hypothetical protein
MTASTTAEMRLRGRPPSPAPADAIARLTGWSPESDEGRERLGTAAHAAVVPALGAADPPWRWGAAELAISAWHHLVDAAAAGVAHEALAS